MKMLQSCGLPSIKKTKLKKRKRKRKRKRVRDINSHVLPRREKRKRVRDINSHVLPRRDCVPHPATRQDYYIKI